MGSSNGRRDKVYLAAKAQVKGLPCHECGNPATIPDHYPPLHTGLPTEGYLPHCQRCSCKQGAHITNTRKKPTPSRQW